MNRHPRLVYTTDCTDQTVTIDYNATLRLFLTRKEHLPFSPERILGMLNTRVGSYHVRITAVGRLHVVVGEARCVLTQQAVHVLAQLYHTRRDLQIAFPFLAGLFAGISLST